MHQKSDECVQGKAYKYNECIYLPRHKGGRLRSEENMYNDVKMKSAAKVKLDNDPHMKIVNKFHPSDAYLYKIVFIVQRSKEVLFTKMFRNAVP